MILLLTLFPAMLMAQEFNAGVFGGMNASQIDRDGYGGYTKLGLNAGVFVNREFTERFFWQLEIKYSARGSYYLGENVVEDFVKTQFRYFELPLSVHYLHAEKFQFELGLAPDVLISFAAYDDQRNEVPQDDPLGDNRRFGLNAFVGVHYWTRANLGFGLRFSYSVIPYSLREGAAVRYLDSGYFHNVLSLSLAYKIIHR
jgi:hypothetical protein